MKIKTSHLSGIKLDYAVILASGNAREIVDPIDSRSLVDEFKLRWEEGEFRFSSEWGQGGQIIDREGISTTPCYTGGRRNTGADAWRADIAFKDGIFTLGENTQYAVSALIAAMRCYVQSRLGDEVEIPEELL